MRVEITFPRLTRLQLSDPRIDFMIHWRATRPCLGLLWGIVCPHGHSRVMRVLSLSRKLIKGQVVAFKLTLASQALCLPIVEANTNQDKSKRNAGPTLVSRKQPSAYLHIAAFHRPFSSKEASSKVVSRFLLFSGTFRNQKKNRGSRRKKTKKPRFSTENEKKHGVIGYQNDVWVP